jgi:site-specific recombinase XerD
MSQTTTKENEIEKLVREFLEYCEIEKNRSHLTIQAYEHYLYRFSEFAATQGATKMKDITNDLVRSFRLALNRMTATNGKQLKLITQNYHVIAVRAFLKYATKRDFETLAAEKIELAKNPSREIDVLSGEELRRIIESVREEKNELLRLRDNAILVTLFSSGVRISELTSLKRDMVNYKSGEFTVRGKGDKLRLSFLSEHAISAIQSYLKKRTDNHPALFINHSSIGKNKVEAEINAQGFKLKGEGKTKPGLTPRSIQRLVKKYAMIAGVMHKVTPHTFRHSFATDLLQNGADIRSVQTLLGHASITTTQIYTHVTNTQLREVHKKFHNKKDN